MSVPSEWTWSDKYPSTVGWYATVLCWDAREGLFPHPLRFDGKDWEEALPVMGYAGPFATKEDADAWGYDHDPEG
jgi:hypothetical protein